MFRILAAAALLTVLVTPTASADTVALECAGTKTTKYTPGLTLDPQQQAIDFEAIFAPCAGTDTEVASARQTDSVTKTTSCLSLGEANPGSSEYVWSNGQKSNFEYQTTVQRPAGLIVITKTGTITAGRFAGATAIETTTGAPLDLTGCLGDGLKSLTSPVTLTIAGL